MRRRRLAQLAAAVLVAAAGSTAAEDKISFSADIAPVLNDHCAICHVTGTEPGHMALYAEAAYKFLVGVQSEESPLKRVEPGDPDKSYLLHKINGTQVSVGGKGQQMPASNPPLSEAMRLKIRQWIVEGARDN